MTIAERLQADLKEAMRAKNADVIASIRSLKAKVQEAVTAKGFSGAIDDDLYRRTAIATAKSLKKAIEELEATGDRGAELRARYRGELAYLEPFLPKVLDEEATRRIVESVIEELGASDPRRAGQVMGAIMKKHREEVDPALVKRLVDECLRPE